MKKRFAAMMFSRGARVLEHPDSGFLDQIVHDNVVVSGEEDASLGATAYAITADARLITLNANAVEHAISEGVVIVDRGIAAVDENVNLADAGGVAGDVDAVGLRDENVGRDSSASSDVGARGPDVVGYGVVDNRSGGPEANLHAVLRSSRSGAETGDDIAMDDRKGAFLIGRDAIFLKIVHSAMIDFDFRHATAAALHEDAGAALAGVEPSRKLEIANGDVIELAGSVQKRNANEVWGACGDAVVRAVDGQAGD